MRFFLCLFVITIITFVSACQKYTEHPELAKNNGMTWASNSEHKVNGNSWVDCYARSTDIDSELASCNAYKGDTQCTAERPLLCINKNASSQQPIAIKASLEKYNREWSQSEVKVTKPIKGIVLDSKNQGDKICADKFGSDWKMAEFHDAGQWGFWAKGNIDPASRFWVAINDQPANCWNEKSQ